MAVAEIEILQPGSRFSFSIAHFIRGLPLDHATRKKLISLLRNVAEEQQYGMGGNWTKAIRKYSHPLQALGPEIRKSIVQGMCNKEGIPTDLSRWGGSTLLIACMHCHDFTDDKRYKAMPSIKLRIPRPRVGMAMRSFAGMTVRFARRLQPCRPERIRGVSKPLIAKAGAD